MGYLYQIFLASVCLDSKYQRLVALFAKHLQSCCSIGLFLRMDSTKMSTSFSMMGHGYTWFSVPEGHHSRYLDRTRNC